MAKNIKKGSSILDIGCGTGMFGDHVHRKCKYKGIDINESFINHAKKKGLNVSLHDIFNFKEYLKKFDVIVICDVLHHIHPKHKLLLEKIKNYANKIIICEPYDIPQKQNKEDELSILERILIILDSDGRNPLHLKSNKRWWYTKENLKIFFKESFKNRKSLLLKEINGDIIAIYNFKNSNLDCSLLKG